MGKKQDQPERQYFAKIGTEEVPLSTAEVEALKDGATFSHSGTFRHFLVKSTAPDGTRYEGLADDLEGAEADHDAQLPGA